MMARRVVEVEVVMMMMDYKIIASSFLPPPSPSLLPPPPPPPPSSSPGRRLEFLPDDEIGYDRGGGPGWVASQLVVKIKEGNPRVVQVRSPVLYTPLDTLPRFAGMCYMKVMTRAQAIEFILHDAFVIPPSSS